MPVSVSVGSNKEEAEEEEQQVWSLPVLALVKSEKRREVGMSEGRESMNININRAECDHYA